MGKELSFKNVKYGKKAERRNYSKMRYDIELPDLIEVQTKSFNDFIEHGITELLSDISPIVGQNGEMKLYFDAHSLEEPKMTIQDAKERDQTYSKTLRAKVKLESVREGQVRETDILLTEIPMMTESGTFIINGAERVVVSQIIRSAGAYYNLVPDKRTNRFKYEGQIIPTRGAWIEYEMDSKETPYVKIDRSRKLPVTTLMRAMGLSKNKDIVNLFGKNKLIEKSFEEDRKNGVGNEDEAVVFIYATIRQEYNAPINEARDFLRLRLFEPRRYDLMPAGRFKLNQKLDLFDRLKVNNKTTKLFAAEDIFDFETGEIIVEEFDLLDDQKIKLLKQHRSSLKELIISYEDAIENTDTDKVFVHSKDGSDSLHTLVGIHNVRTGEVIIEEDTLITEEILEVLRANKLNLDEDIVNYFLEGPSIYEKERQRKGVIVEQLRVYACNNKEELLNKIENKKIDPITIIGNYQKEDKLIITLSDIIASMSYYFNLYDGLGFTDDIDHLGNRRLRLIGELLKNQFRIGLARTEKNIIDKMSTATSLSGTSRSVINSIINMSPLSGAIKTFFGSSQLSQFMDQVNPLAELTQKRRVSALGTGGIARDRAGVEVRDVHSTHYGRICPIETPEGPSIGLISSLSTYAKVDQYGFIQTPYFKLDLSKTDQEGRVIPKVINEIEYLTANEEREKIIASAATLLNNDGEFVERRIIGRHNDDTRLFYRDQFTHMDVSPKQIVSVSTSTIPFLEHDDATRALMGANMQRQAVPLIMPESPIVGTGVEYRAAKDSGAVVVSSVNGYVTYVDANQITITQKPLETIKFGKQVLYDETKAFDFESAEALNSKGLADSVSFDLMKFVRSNQDTFILQKPLVKVGDYVEANDVIADGAATDKGELALGRNVTVAFMTWDGYNYEDAIIMSEDLVKDDVYTSVHIDEYQTETRDIKSTTSATAQEEITREVSQASNEALRKLDPKGIVIVGSEVKEGDILVGKITPKGVNDPSPTERLIQSILGDKSKDYRDTSLKVPHGGGGIVQRIQHYSKANGDKLPPGVNEIVKVFVAQKRKITEGDKMAGRHGNKGVISKILPREDMPYMEDGTTIDILLNPLGVPSRMNIGQILEIHLGMAARSLGIKIATPVFDGVNDKELRAIMEEAKIDLDGKTTLYDGRTGEPFDSKIAVGVMYMIKLSHMVDDKLHARADGPYTLVTQQPMGGKAQNGGQRFGEMEVWALYAYGAAHTLQELLTVKSDDMIGRNAVYSAITQGKKVPKPSIPESFRVFTRELQSLGLYVELVDNETGENEAMKPIFNANIKRGGYR